MKSTPPHDPRLAAYVSKRAAGRTPEPFPADGAGWQPDLFVVHKHAARRTHYDLRMAVDGVLLSWAVPHGPSADPATKRLAVRTEDHPIHYADFEGVIPEGNYGAGAMILWDRGRWVPVEDPVQGLEKGKLLFDLYGHKLKGRWTLVRTQSGDWLWIKKPDAHARDDGAPAWPESSILSGSTVEELPSRAARLQGLIESLNAPPAPADLDGRRLPLMLAQTGTAPFSDPDWIFELKYDGFRMVVEKSGNDVELRLRRKSDVTATFPELARALRGLPVSDVLLDGEVVVLDEQAHPRFQRLQRRVQVSNPVDVRRLSWTLPATFYAFDLLRLEGRDLRRLPLHARKDILQAVVPALGPVRYADHVSEQGEALFRQVSERNLEGVMAKRRTSVYRGGRSEDWLKLPARRTDAFVVIGYTVGQGSRAGFGGLHLASVVDGRLLYSGRVGSGFSQADLTTLKETLDAHPRPDGPAVKPPGPTKPSTWVEPRIWVEVDYLQWTDDGVLRHPVFRRVAREDPVESELETPVAPTESVPRLVLSNRDKVFWPESGLTKGDLLDYYRDIAPFMLPLLRDRPAVLTRFPDGIEGKSFFQKNTPGFTPDWVRRATVWSEHADREIDYLILDDADSLLYAVNTASIPIHVWASRVSSLSTPDWLVLDLDPKGAPFEHVVRIARAAKRLCDDVGLPSCCKTSGSTGLHVLVPTGRKLTYAQARQLAGLLARVLVDELPDIATIDRAIQARKGRVYVDYGQNGHGRLLVAPYSVRPLPRAPVSMPLPWREVTASLDPSSYTMKTAPAKARRRRTDPLQGLLTQAPDFVNALTALQRRY